VDSARGVLEVKPYHRLYKDAHGATGWNNTEVARAAAIENLENAIRTREFKTPDARLVSELRTIVRHPRTGKVEAAAGAHDDIFMTAAIARDVLSRPVQHVPVPRQAPAYRFASNAGRGFG
jgi:hypothetical protein